MSNLPPPPPPPPPGSGGPPSSAGGPPSSPVPDGSRLPLASWGRRAGAFAIDLVIWLLIFFPFILSDAQGTEGGVSVEGSGPSAVGIVSFVLVSLVFGGLLTGLWGRTPGKAALKLKVVSADDHSRTIGFGRGTVREAARGVVNFIPYGIGALLSLVDHLWPLWDDQKQTVHDKVIRSHVVYTGGS